MFPEAARSATREKGEGGGLAETNFFASSRLLVGHSYPLFLHFKRKGHLPVFEATKVRSPIDGMVYII